MNERSTENAVSFVVAASGLTVIAAGTTAVLRLYERSALRKWFDVDSRFYEQQWIDAAGRADSAQVITGAASFALIIGLAVVCYRATAVANKNGATGLYSPGWAAGIWFIPLVNFFGGPIALNNLDLVNQTAERPIGYSWRQREGNTLPLLIAACWIAATTAAVWGGYQDPGLGPATLDEFILPTSWYLAASLLIGSGALLTCFWAVHYNTQARRTSPIDDPLVTTISREEFKKEAKGLPIEEYGALEPWILRDGAVGTSRLVAWFVADDRQGRPQVFLGRTSSASLRRSEIANVTWHSSPIADHTTRLSRNGRIDVENGELRLTGVDFSNPRPAVALDRISELWALGLRSSPAESSISATPRTPDTSSPDAGSDRPSETALALAELGDLLARELITDAEYASLRSQVLSRFSSGLQGA
jgi:hypothetical protein